VAGLKITEFGNPILRQVARPLEVSEISTPDIQLLIASMEELLTSKKLGVGLAAPQIGVGIALAIVIIQVTKLRPEVQPSRLVLINPKIVETSFRRKPLYEGCISGGPGKAGLFGRVPRYLKVRVVFMDETGTVRDEWLDGIVGHVAQHEVDHLNGVLFVDRVKDTTSYVTHKEYLKLVTAKLKEKSTTPSRP
jgi:peptide deformylase